jgi:hypothetical protein
MCPGSDGKPKMKAKSFVSGTYKKLFGDSFSILKVKTELSVFF